MFALHAVLVINIGVGPNKLMYVSLALPANFEPKNQTFFMVFPVFT